MSAVTDLEVSVHEPLSSEELRKINAYSRASNYLAIGMIYLRENPRLKQPLDFVRAERQRLSNLDEDRRGDQREPRQKPRS